MKRATFLNILPAFGAACMLPGCAGIAKRRSDALPGRGLCAHRGAMTGYPENTIPAFTEAVRAGAHMIEFDVYLSKDGQPVVIHDPTVDRTTDGAGNVADLTLAELRRLDAGSWKSPRFKGERIPTLAETLAVMPRNIWLNVHLKGDASLGRTVARALTEDNRLQQAFLACGSEAIRGAREVASGIMHCNMERQASSWKYVDNTIAMNADFIQLLKPFTPAFAEYTRKLSEHGIRINYYGTDDPDEIGRLFEAGVQFPLVNDVTTTMKAVSRLGIIPVKQNS